MQRKFSINIGPPYIENNFHIISCKNQMMDFYKKKLLIWESNPRCMNTWSSWFHKDISKRSKIDLEPEYTTVWSTYHAKRETRAEFNPFIELSKESGPPNMPLSTFLDAVHAPWKHFSIHYWKFQHEIAQIVIIIFCCWRVLACIKSHQ